MLKTFSIIMTGTLLLAACAPAPQSYTSARSTASSKTSELRASSLQAARLEADVLLEAEKRLGRKAARDMSLNALTENFKDPESAKFRNIRRVEYANGIVYCGEVSGKNSYGAYVGYKPFIAGPGGGRIWYDGKYSSVNNAANAGIIDACS